MWVDPELLARVRKLRANPTPAEAALWRCLRARRLGGLKFHFQHVVGPYIVDFLCRPARLIVELDGTSHEGRDEYDSQRQQRLEGWGYRVLRFRNQELSQLERVLGSIEREARQRVTDVGQRGNSGRPGPGRE